MSAGYAIAYRETGRLIPKLISERPITRGHLVIGRFFSIDYKRHRIDQFQFQEGDKERFFSQ
jgi:hypothetical protein